MTSFIPYGMQDISSDDIDAVTKVLQSDFLTQGTAVPMFEGDLAKYTGANHALMSNSATSSLHLACKALDVGKGDMVWTSPISFVASSNCALYCGASVDFVDIDPESNNISIDALTRKLELAEKSNSLPKVIIPVHLAGFSADMKKIFELSKIYNFNIIEDASHALGGEYDEKKIGCCDYSDCCIFSFHPVKIIATGEGGALLTNNQKLANTVDLLRSHGITKDPVSFYRNEDAGWYYEQHELGFNYRMTDIQAALGISQMKRLDEFLARRKEIFYYYQENLKDLPLTLPPKLNGKISSNHLFIIKLDLDKAKISHKTLFHSLRKKGIGVNLHYIPIYKHPYYEKLLDIQESQFPESEKYYSTAISLPIFFKLERESLQYICNTLKELLS